jgi:predicted transcriptional regulator
MSLSIPFPPEIEEQLRRRAAAAGKDVSTFVREAVEEKLGLGAGTYKTNGEWNAEFSAWMRDVAARASNYPSNFMVDDSRESIYEGHGE